MALVEMFTKLISIKLKSINFNYNYNYVSDYVSLGTYLANTNLRTFNSKSAFK